MSHSSSRVHEQLSRNVPDDIKALVGEKFYPCVSAVQSVAKGDFLVEICEDFGTGRDREKIRTAVLNFLERWKSERSTTLTLFVAFPGDQAAFQEASEDEFERLMWSELSTLSSVEERDSDWAEGWSKDPADKNFTLCIGGHAFFVVGLHQNSSRKGRRLPYPALIFNFFDQFNDLQKQGAYDAMVIKNRERDVRFQGEANPMAVTHGESWETIQFSGRSNSREWKCPFHFKSRT